MIEKRYITTTLGQIHLRHTGRQELTPLILLHQTASSSTMYNRLMIELANRFWLIAPDMAGFGQSDAPDNEAPTISLHADLFWEVLDHLNVKRCAIFGHHTGASVAIQMAHNRPTQISHLALSGPALLTDNQIEVLRRGLLPIKLDENGRFLQDTWERLRKKEPAAPLSLTTRETLLTIQAGDSYPAAYRAVFDHPMAQQLSALSCPTLLMAGTNDSLYASLDAAAACLPADLPHQVHHIPNAGSYICDNQPALVANLLTDFLASY